MKEFNVKYNVATGSGLNRKQTIKAIQQTMQENNGPKFPQGSINSSSNYRKRINIMGNGGMKNLPKISGRKGFSDRVVFVAIRKSIERI